MTSPAAYSAPASTPQPSLLLLAPHRSELTLNPIDQGYVDWIHDSQLNGYSFYRFDIAFNSSGASRPHKWLEYFDRKVAFKIQKRLGASVPVNSLIREYEYGIKSRNRVSRDWRSPHHIHALIGVPSALGHKMTGHRLKIDLKSLPEVSSVYIALIPDNDLDPTKTVKAAYCYMRKGKTYRPLGSD